MPVVIERIPYDPVVWDAVVQHHPQAEVFHSAAWLEFLAMSQRAEPVVAIVRADGRQVGHFVGAIVRRYGMRILGSPLRGWGTQAMGFLLEDGADRRAAAEALIQFATQDLGCVHVELSDRWLTAEQMIGSGYQIETGRTYVVDLQPPEDVVMHGMQRTTRQAINKAIRQGLRTEVATDDGFADEFYGYLTAVFARQGLIPTYGIDRVRQLIQALLPSGQLLLLRVRAPDGATLATGIALGGQATAVAWGMAFERGHESFHAIELLWWETMRHWRTRSCVRYDMGGGGAYKAKYGGVETTIAHFYRSRFGFLRVARALVRRLFRIRQMIAGFRSP